MFRWCQAALEWFSVQGSYLFGRYFCLFLFNGCCGVSWTISLDCSPASDAVDWFAFDVWMDIRNVYCIIWRLSSFGLSVGKTCGITSSILVTSWVFGLWFWKTYVIKSKAYSVVLSIFEFEIHFFIFFFLQ